MSQNLSRRAWPLEDGFHQPPSALRSRRNAPQEDVALIKSSPGPSWGSHGREPHILIYPCLSFLCVSCKKSSLLPQHSNSDSITVQRGH